VPYVVDGGFGVYTGNKPVKVASAVSQFFNDEKLLRRMSRRARELSHQDATTSIARDMGRMLFDKTSTRKSSPRGKQTLELAVVQGPVSRSTRRNGKFDS